jgi:hypothetical protein
MSAAWHGGAATIEVRIVFTTKDTKSTKFGVSIIRNLRVLRVLRGEIE